MRKILWLVPIVSLFLAGCSLLNGGEPDAAATQEPVVLTPLPSPTTPATPQVIEPDSTATTVLNIWLVGEFSPETDLPGSVILAEQLATFQTNRPGVDLNVEVKAVSGPGGSLSYLRSGRNVAPSVLPDVILLSADQLETAASEQLVFPLDDLVVEDALEDLYPAPATLSRIGDQVYGYPFALDNLSHMAFSSTIYTGTLPVTWDDMLADERSTFTFPGSGPAGAELAIQLYLANGGSLMTESGQPLLEVNPLASALTLLLEGREGGLLPIQTTNLTVLDEAWQLYNNGEVNSVQTVETQFVVRRETSPDSGYIGIPGLEAPLAPLVKAWTWAISTPDPARQVLAADLLNWLVAAPNMGDFTLAGGKLPARRTAFDQWPAGDDYLTFIQQELELADPYPYVANGPILDAVSIAVFEVLSLSKTPQQAAQDAVATLSP